MQTLAEFEAEVIAKRKRLEKDHALVKSLPTIGVNVTWIGEGGFEKDGNTRKPNVEKTVEVLPWIVYSRSYQGHEHVGYRVPEAEYRYSEFYDIFRRKYLKAILDAYAPHLIDIVAVKGQYASHLPVSYDYKNARDYKDAVEVARGRYEVTVSSGGDGYQSNKLEFYAQVGAEVVQVSIEIPISQSRLMPRARYESEWHNATPVGWIFPSPKDVGAVNLWKRANATSNSHGAPTGYTLEWLFADSLAMEAATGMLR